MILKCSNYAVLVRVFSPLTNIEHFMYLSLRNVVSSHNITALQQSCEKVMLSVLYVFLSVPMWPHTYGSDPACSPPLALTPQTCSNLFTWGPALASVPLDMFKLLYLPPSPFPALPDLFKLVHYVAHTSIGKRAVSPRLKDLVPLKVCISGLDSFMNIYISKDILFRYQIQWKIY